MLPRHFLLAWQDSPADDDLNSNPWFQFAVKILIFAVGALLIWRGFAGIRDRKLRLRYGIEVSGVTAQVLGVVYVAIGIALAIAGIAMVVMS